MRPEHPLQFAICSTLSLLVLHRVIRWSISSALAKAAKSRNARFRTNPGFRTEPGLWTESGFWTESGLWTESGFRTEPNPVLYIFDRSDPVLNFLANVLELSMTLLVAALVEIVVGM